MWNDGPVDIDDWERAGLYDPHAPAADERRLLLEFLSERGATLEEMIEAHRFGGLPGLAGTLVLGTPTGTVSVQELAARCQVSEERVRRVLLASGVPVAADGRLPEVLAGIITVFEQGAALMGEEAILAFARVLGAASTNIAEAAVALFYAELGPGTGREGSDELARARVSEAATEAFAGVPQVLSDLLLVQFGRATRRALLARSWLAPTEPSDGVFPLDPSSEIVALGFVDLVGSTLWAEQNSLRDQSLALSRFESSAWSSALLAGGRVVKMIGDEVFFTAPSVDAACRIGTEVCQAAALDPALPPARGAIGFGTAIPREGDYFGPIVNLVARLVKLAAPGELVITEEAAATLPAGRWIVRALGPHQIRGVHHPVPIFAVGPPTPPGA